MASSSFILSSSTLERAGKTSLRSKATNVMFCFDGVIHNQRIDLFYILTEGYCLILFDLFSFNQMAIAIPTNYVVYEASFVTIQPSFTTNPAACAGVCLYGDFCAETFIGKHLIAKEAQDNKNGRN